MAVYVILDIEVIDWDIFPEYKEKIGPVVEKFRGRILAKGGEVTPLFGDWQVNRIIIVEFSSKAQMKDCVESDEYLALKAIRDRSAKTKGILVEGLS